MSFSPAVINILRQFGKEQSYDAGYPIVRRGEKGRAFYAIISGKVEVRLSANDRFHLTLACLGPGDSFGEMALLCGEPVSADVITLEETLVIKCPDKSFKTALSKYAPFRNELMARMAVNIQKTSIDAWKLFQESEALKQFSQVVHHDKPFIAESASMKHVIAAINKHAGAGRPFIISGEPGTGKFFAAMKIHESVNPPEAPLFAIDCRDLDKHEIEMFRFGGEKIGLFHLAHQGTLIMRHIDRAVAPVNHAVGKYLQFQKQEGGNAYPRVRLIATTCKKADPLNKSGPSDNGFDHYDHAIDLNIPSLNERKEDILPLAYQFLNDLDDTKKLRLTKEAEDMLLSHRYRYRNADELYEAVKLAVLFAPDKHIGSEHIFFAQPDRTGLTEYDLERLNGVKWLLSGNVINVIRSGVLISFGIVILLCLLAADSMAGQVSNKMIWGFWEPAVIFLFIFLGHIWCMVCPVSLIGRGAKRIMSLSRPPPTWIKRFGIWAAIAGFFLIVWSERVFHMASNPVATGILFTMIICAAVVFSVVYRREVWCRYVCPLGMLATCYEFPSMLQLHANPKICTTDCKTHTCYKGTADSEGCPVFHHPLFVNRSHECKLCLNCLKMCPHGSVKLYLRPPLQTIWSVDGVARGLAPFAFTVFFLAMILLAAGSLGHRLNFVDVTAMMLLAIFGGALLNRYLYKFLFSAPKPDQVGGYIARIGFTLMLLAWGPLMAYQLSNIPILDTLTIQASAGSFLDRYLPAAPVLLLIQSGVIILAFVFFIFSFGRVKRRAAWEGIKLNQNGWRIFLSFCILYTVIAVFLI